MTSRTPTALFAVPELIYSIVLAVSGKRYVFSVLAALIAVHAITHLLPWRVPRDDRTSFGYWIEVLVCTSPLVMSTALWFVFPVHGTWASLLPRPPLQLSPPVWFGIAGIGAAVLVRLSGINLASLRTGDLAFLIGPLAVDKVAARICATAFSVVAEEVVYRGIPAGIVSYRPVTILCAAIAFIANHHMVRGTGVQIHPRVICFEASAAMIFGGLVMLSGSIWPAVLAHTIANIPHVVLDIQRARCHRAEYGRVSEVVK